MSRYSVKIIHSYTVIADTRKEAIEVAAAAMGEDIYELFQQNDVTTSDNFDEFEVTFIDETQHPHPNDKN